MIVPQIRNFPRYYARFRASTWRERSILLRRQYLPRLLAIGTFLPLLLLAVGLRSLLLLLMPFVHIRFGQLHSFQLGAYGIPMEAYLCQREAGVHPKRSLDLFYHYVHQHYLVALERDTGPQGLICNQQLDKMICSKLRVWEPARALDSLNGRLPGGSERFQVTSQQPYDKFGLFRRFPSQLQFTEEEEQQGLSALVGLGIDPNAKFVCFHARDGEWLERAHPRVTSLYGQWNKREERNASIHNILLAAEQLSELGYYAVRMGKFVKEPIDAPNSKVIDYATRSHSDFMDLYLSAKCEFFLGTNSGMTHPPAIFRRPLVLVNVYPMGCIEEGVTYQDHIFLPKLFFSGERGRLLTFREILDEGLGWFYLTSQNDWDRYDRMGMKILENTPEEIAQVTMEMHQRLNATFETAKEDEQQQDRFWSILRSYPDVIHFESGVEPNFRIGTEFLRSHPELLD